ncbi:MAG: hypothetical protein SOW25_00910 [Helicobacter sp.]|nr:hypothetical protein [Helicobacteraceae bacterium]MDY3112873.1 hypothetical protein [Helicobacter sp.]
MNIANIQQAIKEELSQSSLSKENLLLLEVLKAYGNKELAQNSQEKQDLLISALNNQAPKEKIQTLVFDYRQIGLFASGSYFFSLTFNTLSKEQQDSIMDALAVVHSYFLANSLEIDDFKISWDEKDGEWSNFEITNLKPSNINSLIKNIENTNIQTLFDLSSNTIPQLPKQTPTKGDMLFKSLWQTSDKYI